MMPVYTRIATPELQQKYLQEDLWELMGCSHKHISLSLSLPLSYIV